MAKVMPGVWMFTYSVWPRWAKQAPANSLPSKPATALRAKSKILPLHPTAVLTEHQAAPGAHRDVVGQVERGLTG